MRRRRRENNEEEEGEQRGGGRMTRGRARMRRAIRQCQRGGGPHDNGRREGGNEGEEYNRAEPPGSARFISFLFI